MVWILREIRLNYGKYTYSLGQGARLHGLDTAGLVPLLQ